MNKRIGMCFTAVLLCLSAEMTPLAVSADTTTTAAETTASVTSETTTASAAPPETTSVTTSETTVPVTSAAQPHSVSDPLSRMKYELLPDGTARLTEFRWESDELEVQIPAQIDGRDITAVGERAFLYCYADTVVLPEGIRRIEANAFAGCAYLNRMSIPEGCMFIGEAAFQNCERLSTVEIPGSVTEIGWKAFDGTPFYSSRSGETVILGDGILYAYQGSGTAPVIPDTVKIIAPHAFEGHEELKSLTIPDSVSRIQPQAFCGCTSLSEINAPATLDALAPDALTDTAWFKNASGDYVILGDLLVKYRGSDTVAEVPDGIRVINDESFAGDAGVTTVYLPDSAEEIRSSAFSGCTSLQVAKLGENLKTVGDSAFRGCSTLKYIRFGHQLQSLGADSFAGCPYLEEVYLPDTLKEIQPHALGYAQNEADGSYDRIRNSLVIYSNTESARQYAEAAGITHEPLPDVENTEPAPEVTTVRGQGGGIGKPSGTAWIPTVLFGGFLVFIGMIAAIRRRRQE